MDSNGSYAETCAFVRARLLFALVRASSSCLRESKINWTMGHTIILFLFLIFFCTVMQILSLNDQAHKFDIKAPHAVTILAPGIVII